MVNSINTPANKISIHLMNGKLAISKILLIIKRYYFYYGATAPSGPGPPHYREFTITFRNATLGRTPLDV